MLSSQPLTPKAQQVLKEQIKTWKINNPEEEKGNLDNILFIRGEVNMKDEMPNSHEKIKVANERNNENAQQSPKKTKQSNPQPSTSGVNQKALRQDPRSRRSPLEGDMKPNDSSTSRDTGVVKIPRFRSLAKQMSEDEKGQVRTTTILEKMTDSDDSDDTA